MGFSKQWVLSFLLLVAECCCKLWRQPPGMALSDFERCLVYLNEKTANSSVSLYEQKSCIKHAHAGASAESSVTEFCFIGQVGPKVVSMPIQISKIILFPDLLNVLVLVFCC